MRNICLLFFLLSSPLFSEKKRASPPKVTYSPSLQALFFSLDPKSISDNLNFYKLYPKSPLGKKAYKRALTLLSQGKEIKGEIDLPKIDLSILVSMVQKEPLEDLNNISNETIEYIEHLSQDLYNRDLKGRNVWTKEALLALKPEEIDLSRALFLAEFDYDQTKKKMVRYYEASIDLMSLQILAHLPRRASAEEKIRKINDFIFHKMQFRFPPHSLYAKNIDTYTFLPSVIDNRKGVCLGVSLLYQCIAQRLNLKLESITPPGHIYVRYVDQDKEINIETTNRGVDMPTEQYKGIETITLQKRDMKELIGLAFMNQASVFWQKEDFKKSVELYEKALDFIRDDALLKELYGYNLLFLGEEKKGLEVLNSIRNTSNKYLLSERSILEDFLANKTDAEGIKSIFMSVDETRSSILKKQEKLKDIIEKFPSFRAGLLQLASSHLQLLEEKKALNVLNQYYAICPDEAIINYYLSIIHLERLDFKKAWKHLHFLEKTLINNHLESKQVTLYKKHLMKKCPLFPESGKKHNEIAEIKTE